MPCTVPGASGEVCVAFVQVQSGGRYHFVVAGMVFCEFPLVECAMFVLILP